MNFLIALKFSICLLVLQVAIGFVSPSAALNEDAGMPLILSYAVEYVLSSIAVIAVLALLCRKPIKSPYFNAFLVLLISEALAVLITFAITGRIFGSPLWFFDYGVMVLSAVVGIRLGLRLRANGTIRVRFTS